jgi:hypothetical protein
MDVPLTPRGRVTAILRAARRFYRRLTNLNPTGIDRHWDRFYIRWRTRFRPRGFTNDLGVLMMSGDVQELDLRTWFQASELELCPECGEQQLVPPSPLALIRLCLACGVLTRPLMRAARPKQMRGVQARRA